MFIHKYSLLFIVLLLGACTSDMYNDTLLNSGYEMQVTLDSREVTELSTKAPIERFEPGEDVLNENLIERSNILFFDGNTPIWKVPRNAMQIQNESPTQKKLLIRVPKDLAPSLNGKELTMVVVVNGPSPRIEQVDSWQNLSELTVETDLNTAVKQHSFLMTSIKKTGIIKFTQDNPHNLGHVKLLRAAAKIRLKINKIDIENFTLEGEPEAALVNYPNKTAILPDYELTKGSYLGYKTTDYQALRLVNIGSQLIWTNAIPNYAYENNWATDDGKETYLIIKLYLKPKGSNRSSLPYYYRVPLTGINSNTDRSAVLRNHLYNINVNIEKLGKESGELPLELNAFVSVKEWEATDAIQMELEKASFLTVKEKDIIMANTSKYDVEYISSSDVSIRGAIKATYIGYDNNGKELPPKSPWRMPTVEFNAKNGKKYFTISSDIPINYVPLNIEFTIQNREGLTELIKVVQYPPRYITAYNPPREWNDYYKGTEGESRDKTNHTMFTITTLVPEVGDIIGDPVTRYDGKTGFDEKSNTIISPKFIIASQLGVTRQRYLDRDGRDGESGETRCSKYYERDYGPGKKHGGRWRLPTKAEIEYIQRLQQDRNSAVKNLLQGQKYWSAYRYAFYNFYDGYWPSANGNSQAHIRCVYDVYKYVK